MSKWLEAHKVMRQEDARDAERAAVDLVRELAEFDVNALGDIFAGALPMTTSEARDTLSEFIVNARNIIAAHTAAVEWLEEAS